MWVLIKTEKGSNNALFEYFYDDGKGGAKNVLAVKTGDEAGTLVFAINNTSVSMNITNNKWFHLCWTLEKVDAGSNLANWKIYINGKSAISLSNKVYLDKSIANNRILLGKGDNGSATKYFNGNLAEISLYDIAIDPKLDIYQDDPTIKYIINAGCGGGVGGAEGFESGFGCKDVYDYGLNRYVDSGMGLGLGPGGDGGVSYRVIEDVGDRGFPIVSGDMARTSASASASTSASTSTVPPPPNYENLGLGIFFIILSVVIYRYF
jgi:hypothetical protein